MTSSHLFIGCMYQHTASIDPSLCRHTAVESVMQVSGKYENRSDTTPNSLARAINTQEDFHSQNQLKFVGHTRLTASKLSIWRTDPNIPGFSQYSRLRCRRAVPDLGQVSTIFLIHAAFVQPNSNCWPQEVYIYLDLLILMYSLFRGSWSSIKHQI